MSMEHSNCAVLTDPLHLISHLISVLWINGCVTTSVTLMYFYKVVYLFQSFLVITVYPLSFPPSPFFIINLFPPFPFFVNYLFYVLYLIQLPLLHPLYFITFPIYNLYILWSSPSISFIFFHLTLTRSF